MIISLSKGREKGDRLLRQRYLGKTVKVQFVNVFGKNSTVVGVCTHIGYNEFMMKRQITVGRFPIFPASYGDLNIQIVEPKHGTEEFKSTYSGT